MNRTINLFWIVLTCCSSPSTTDSKETKDSLTTGILLAQPSPDDSIGYIGFVQKFQESDEFYTDIYFKDPYDYRNYEDVAKLVDSVIFQDDETKRSRIPFEYANQYFDLSGIGTIEIFSSSGNLLTTGELTRIELFDDMITSGFVAVYKLVDPKISDFSYCIGNNKWQLDQTQSYAAFSSEELSSSINKMLNLQDKQLWEMEHFRLMPTNESYSVISADTTAFIVETMNDKMTVLYSSDYSESINAIVILPIRINDKPILLANCTVPETDSDWTILLTFDGKEYKDNKRCRISY